MGHNNDSSQPTSISVHQHSAILYWWPVWAVGFLFAALSFVFGERVEVDPADLEATLLGRHDPAQRRRRRSDGTDEHRAPQPAHSSLHDRPDPLRWGSSDIPPKSSAGNSIP